MTIEKALELLDKAWAESRNRFGGASDEPKNFADASPEVDGDTDLGRALDLLDKAWQASQRWFDRDEQLSRLKTLFPLYLLEQVHQSRPLSFDEWMTWIEQVKCELVNPDDLTVSAADVDGMLEQIGRVTKEFRDESQEITPWLIDQEGSRDAGC